MILLAVHVEVGVVRRALDRFMLEAIANVATRTEFKVRLGERPKRRLQRRPGHLQPVPQVVAVLKVGNNVVEVECVQLARGCLFTYPLYFSVPALNPAPLRLPLVGRR